MKCLVSLLLSLVLWSACFGQQTEQQFAQFVLNELRDVDAQLDHIEEQASALSNQLKNAVAPPIGARNNALLEQLTSDLEDLDDQFDDRLRYKGTLLKNAEKEANQKFGKALKMLIPLPGAMDFGVAIWFAQDTAHDYGVAAAVGEVAVSALPDVVQVFNLAIGGGASGGALAIITIQDAMAKQQEWIDRYNELMKATDWRRQRVRTRHGIEGAKNELQAALIQVQNAPVIGFTADESKVFEDKARYLRNMQYQIDLLNEIQAYDRYKSGDFNWSGGSPNNQDRDIILQNYGRSGLDPKTSGDLGDTDYDGDVDFQDWLEFNANYQP